MFWKSNNSRIDVSRSSRQVAVLTVNLQADVRTSLRTEVNRRSWQSSFSDLDTHISPTRRPSFVSQIKTADTCLAFVDFEGAAADAIESTQYLLQAFPGKLTVIAVASKPDPQTILTAMRAGCSEFLTTPVQEPALIDILDRIEAQWSAPGSEAARQGSMLAFVGAKGGVGTTTLVVHLATYLARYHGKKVLLIDARTELGHVCVYLGVDGSHHPFQEVVRNVDRLDSELLRGFAIHHSSGLDVMSSPDDMTNGRPMQVESVRHAIAFLRSEYDYVVVDCDPTRDELLNLLVELSTVFYLVGTPEVGAIRDLSRRVDQLTLTPGASEKMQVVINRSTSPYAVPIEQIEQAMKMSVTVRIPNNFAELVHAGNLGEPLAPESHAAMAKAMMSWADQLAGARGTRMQVKRDRGLLNLLKQNVTAHP